MSVENLSLLRTPPHKNIPPDAESTLFFEPTIEGLIAARDWIKKHSHLKKLFRIVVPYSKSFKNPVLYTKEDVYPAYTTALLDVAELEPLDAIQSMVDVLHEQCTLRQVKSGLSKIQERMLDLQSKGLSRDEILGATSMMFRIPMQTIRQEFNKLSPTLRVECLPYALCSSCSPKDLASAVVQKINTGVCSFPDAPNWDPRFLEGTFDMQACFALWLDDALDVYVRKLAVLREGERKLNLKRKLIRTLCTAQFDMNTEKVLFLGESTQEKRRRIQQEYESDYTLLETTIAECTMNFLFEHDKTMPESARDLLIDEASHYL
jgi:hypothetical protein